jgi:hypothetical protein
MTYFFKLDAVVVLISPVVFAQAPGKTRTYYIRNGHAVQG